MKTIGTLVLALVVATMAEPAPAQDSIQLLDGRFVLDKKMTRTADGVTVHFENGDIFIADAVIQSTTARGEGDAENSAEDQEKIDQGLVRDPNGRWVSARVAERRADAMRKAREKMIEDATAHRKWANRYEEQTSNFAFEYTIDPVVMEDYKELMETYFTYFTKEWGIRRPRNVPRRLKVCFYHEKEYFHQVTGTGSNIGGYFRFVAPLELDFYFDRMDPEQTVAIMFHEANHYLTHLIDPKFAYPRWVDESLGEYYGASTWDPETKKMTVGGIQEGRLAVVREAAGLDRIEGTGTVSSTSDDVKWQDLEELIGLPQSRFTSLHYAWGWTFVHFMFHGEGGKYARDFKRFYKALPEDRKIPKVPFRVSGMVEVKPEDQKEAFMRYLKIKDLGELEKEWHAYVRGLKGNSAVGKVLAGRLALRDDLPIKATRLFNEAIEAGDVQPIVYYYLGQAHYDRREYQEALDNFKKYADLDPLNGMAYVHMARCVERMGKDEAEVKRLRGLALEVDPDNYSVFVEVGFEGRN